MDLWNKKDLDAPPIHTIQVKDRNLDLQALLYIISEAEETFTNQQFLEAEAALLSRCIYRMKMKFRSDKGFKALEKTNRALLQYRHLDVLNMLQQFKEIIPLKYNKEYVYLPTLSMVDYILVRIQGLSKLLCRISECAKVAGYFLENRIFIGHLWKVAFITFGLVSRVFVISRYYTKYCCKFFNELVQLRPYFKNSKFEWLPKDYIYPKKLDQWLNVDWLFKDDILKLPTQKTFAMYNFEEDSDVECSGEYIDIDDDFEIVDQYVDITEDINVIAEIKDDINVIDSYTKNIVKDVIKGKNYNKHGIKAKEIIFDLGEDIGETIIDTKQKNKKSKSKANNIDSINSLEELQMFMKVEMKLRKKKSGNSNFKHLDLLEWNMLQNSINNLISKANKKTSSYSVVQKAKYALKLKIK